MTETEKGEAGEASPPFIDSPNCVGFTENELREMRAAFVRGRKGCILVALRNQTRLLSLYLPPTATEAAALRQMREVIRRLRAVKVDGWMLVRCARASHTISTVKVMLVQECFFADTRRHEKCVMYRLDANEPMLTCHSCSFTDGVIAVLNTLFQS